MKNDPYEAHKLIYDIIDEAVRIRFETIRLSEKIDETYTLTNAQQGLLGMIYRYEGATQSELAAIYQRDLKNIIKGVRTLEKRGLVTKGRTGMAKPVFLTDEGRSMNDRLMAHRGQMIDQLLATLPNEALEQARGTLKQLSAAMADYVDGISTIKQFPE